VKACVENRHCYKLGLCHCEIDRLGDPKGHLGLKLAFVNEYSNCCRVYRHHFRPQPNCERF
jgi:hypothetical protein